MSEQGSEIAVADENLGMRSTFSSLVPQQIVRAIAAARAQDGAYFVTARTFLLILDFAGRCSRKINIALQDRIK